MKPLYRFDFNPDTGCVNDAIVITAYELLIDAAHKFVYYDPILKTHPHKYIDDEDINHFSSNRVYLWEDNKELAISIIKEVLEKRVSEAYLSYIKAQNILNTFKGVQYE